MYLHSPSTPSWRGAQLKKHRENFTLTLPCIPVCEGMTLCAIIPGSQPLRTRRNVCFCNQPVTWAMTGLQTADTEENSLGTVYEKLRVTVSPIISYNTAPLSLIPLGGNNTNHHQMSDRNTQNLIMDPYRA